MMDDMNAFERQLSNVVQRAARPPRPVDAMTIVTVATTTSSRWRFQTMFSATKFVVAGVIVALFGGFLVTNVGEDDRRGHLIRRRRIEEAPQHPRVGLDRSSGA